MIRPNRIGSAKAEIGQGHVGQGQHGPDPDVRTELAENTDVEADQPHGARCLLGCAPGAEGAAILLRAARCFPAPPATKPGRPAGRLMVHSEARETGNGFVMIVPALMPPRVPLSCDAVQNNDDPDDCVQQRRGSMVQARQEPRVDAVTARPPSRGSSRPCTSNPVCRPWRSPCGWPPDRGARGCAAGSRASPRTPRRGCDSPPTGWRPRLGTRRRRAGP